MEEFFRSMNGQFAQQRTHEGRAALFVAFGVALLILVWLGARVRRAWRARQELAAFAASRSIGRDELSLAIQLSRQWQRDVIEFLEQVDLFELVTSKALASPLGASQAGGIGKLRRALAYDRLPDYMPLHTSRELPVGTEVRIGTAAGEIVETNEQTFALLLDGQAPRAVGEQTLIELPHAREALYRLHCKLLAAETNEAATQTRLTFAHDEAPLHVRTSEQRRPARGVVVLRSALAGTAEQEPEQKADLIEASAQELVIQSVLPLVSGRLIDCSFSLGGQSFQRLRAVIHTVERTSHGQRATLELRGLSEAVRERLHRAIES